MSILYDSKNPLLTSAATLSGAYRAAQEIGIDLHRSLALLGWRQQWLKAPKGYIAYHKAVEFLNHVAHASDCPSFGHLVGKYQPPGTYGLPLQALKLCASGIDAVDLASRYHLLVSEVSVWDLVRRKHHGELRRRERVRLDIDQRQMHELAVTTVYTFTKHLFQGQPGACAIHFAHPMPAHAVEMQEFFACPVHFNQETNALLFPTGTLNAPLRTADPTLLDATLSYLDARNLGYQLDDDLSHKVYAHIKQSLGTHECNLESVAQLLGQSPRSVQRELSKSGNQFRDLLNKARVSVAEHYLNDSNISATDLAQLLGYRNSSAFSRAFKKQTGLSPDHWRKQAIEQGSAKGSPS